jgi:hypothetical protein
MPRFESTTYRAGSKHFSSGPKAPGRSVMPWVFGGIGLLMLLASGLWYWSSVQFRGGAVRAEGTVVRIKVTGYRDSNTRGGPVKQMYDPIVTFRTAEGHETEITGLGVGGEAAYKVGEHVPVLYPPEHPEDGKIDSDQEFWLGPMVCAIFGALFTGAGLLIHRLKL